MKDLVSKINEGKESVVFALSENDLDKILFSLAFTAGWSSNVNSYEMKEYKKLWDELNKEAKKSFNDERYVDDWSDYEMSHTGSFKRLH
jgi:hypothetical protein